MAKSTEMSADQAKFHVGDEVGFKLEGTDFTGFIDKGYNNSFLITFESSDPEIIDKYHNKVVINNKQLKMIKAAPQPDPEPEENEEDSK